MSRLQRRTGTLILVAKPEDSEEYARSIVQNNGREFDSCLQKLVMTSSNYFNSRFGLLELFLDYRDRISLNNCIGAYSYIENIADRMFHMDVISLESFGSGSPTETLIRLA